MRHGLVAALVACAHVSYKPKARRFLAGLSNDELQFIAASLGACMLEPSAGCRCSRAQLAERIAFFQQSGRVASQPVRYADEQHKMILLLEYLCRSGIERFPVPAAVAAQWN